MINPGRMILALQQNHPGQRPGPFAGLLFPPHPVHAGPDAFRCDRLYLG